MIGLKTPLGNVAAPAGSWELYLLSSRRSGRVLGSPEQLFVADSPGKKSVS